MIFSAFILALAWSIIGIIPRQACNVGGCGCGVNCTSLNCTANCPSSFLVTLNFTSGPYIIYNGTYILSAGFAPCSWSIQIVPGSIVLALAVVLMSPCQVIATFQNSIFGGCTSGQQINSPPPFGCPASGMVFTFLGGVGSCGTGTITIN